MSLTAAAAGLALNCWAAAAYRYNLPVDLLYAIAQVESSHNPRAISKPNANGTRDLGIMQINSSWLPVLNQYGITREVLIEKPCTNIQVGAWILAQEVARTGYTWHSIGAYNAGPITAKTSAKLREKKIATYRVYAGKVLARWKELSRRRNAPATQPLTAKKPPEIASADR